MENIKEHDILSEDYINKKAQESLLKYLKTNEDDYFKYSEEFKQNFIKGFKIGYREGVEISRREINLKIIKILLTKRLNVSDGEVLLNLTNHSNESLQQMIEVLKNLKSIESAA